MPATQVPRILPPKLTRGCIICHSTTNCQSCSDCHVALFCTEEHLLEHQELHRSECSAVKEARETVRLEEADLREVSANSPGGLYAVPQRVFEDCVGYFWDILGTRDYMMARLAYTDALLGFSTLKSVEMVVSEFEDMLRLMPRKWDALEIDLRICGPLMRLGRDLECYAYLKEAANPLKYAKSENRARMTLDLTEDLDKDLNISLLHIGYWIPALILKVKLWMNLREIQHTSRLFTNGPVSLPPELLINVQLCLANEAAREAPSIVSDIRHGRDLKPHMKHIREHIRTLNGLISKTEFWYFMSRKDEFMKTLIPRLFVDQFDEPVVVTLRRNYRTLVDTPHLVRMIELFSLEDSLGEEGRDDDEEEDEAEDDDDDGDDVSSN